MGHSQICTRCMRLHNEYEEDKMQRAATKWLHVKQIYCIRRGFKIENLKPRGKQADLISV